MEDWEDVVGETPTTATETGRAPRVVRIVGFGFGVSYENQSRTTEAQRGQAAIKQIWNRSKRRKRREKESQKNLVRNGRVSLVMVWKKALHPRHSWFFYLSPWHEDIERALGLRLG